MFPRWMLILSALMALSAGTATAQRFHYVVPPDHPASVSPDGSADAPWQGVDAALEAAKGGDIILLNDGAYGALRLRNVMFDLPVLIQSLNGKNAHFDFIWIDGESRNLSFRNLSVWEDTDATTQYQSLVQSGADTAWLTFEGLDIRGRGAEADSYLTWTADEWREAQSAVLLRGDDSLVRDCLIRGVGMGIALSGDRSEAVGNFIEGFAGDGLRAIGDFNRLVGNFVMNNVVVDENHDDGIQSWATEGAVRALVIEGNRIFEWTGPEAHPLRGPLQGIGLFDGFFDGLTIRNNLVEVSAWHGISVYGGRGVDIVNNTVVPRASEGASLPWIGVFAHKNGVEARDVRVANNVAPRFNMKPDASRNILYRNNFRLIAVELSFADPVAGDFRPREGSALIDAGDADLAPPADIDGVLRRMHGAPDIGAFELASGSE